MRALLLLLLASPEYLPDTTEMLLAAIADGIPNDATAALAQMPGLYGKSEAADQKKAIAAVGKAARSNDLRVRHGAFAALGAIKAKGSSKYLGKWLKPPKRFKGEIPSSFVEAIRAAGAIADTSTQSQLDKLSKHGELEIATAATEALGGYHTLPLKRRKALAIDLCKRLALLSTPPGRRGNWDPASIARRAGLSRATIKALQGVTGEKYNTPGGWKAWRERAEKQSNPFE